MNASRLVGVAALLSMSIPLSAAEPADQPVAMVRFDATEIAAMAAAAKPGTGPQTTKLVGDPAKPGLYTVRVAIPAKTQVPAHIHRDNRSVTVVSGTWRMGYGPAFDEKA